MGWIYTEPKNHYYRYSEKCRNCDDADCDSCNYKYDDDWNYERDDEERYEHE